MLVNYCFFKIKFKFFNYLRHNLMFFISAISFPVIHHNIIEQVMTTALPAFCKL